MITATRRPDPTWKGSDRLCYRCGIVWNDDHKLWEFRAPCSSCRKQLRREGVDLAEFKRKREAA